MVLLERQVNDPAIMCAHRAGCERPVGFLDLVAQLARQFSQAQLTFGTIVFRVNDYGNIFSGLFADYLGYQELECVERLAPLANEQARTVADYIQVVVSFFCLAFDDQRQINVLEYLVQNFLRLLGASPMRGVLVVTRILAFLIPTIPKIPEDPFEIISISSFSRGSFNCWQARSIASSTDFSSNSRVDMLSSVVHGKKIRWFAGETTAKRWHDD